jgi:lysozyme
MRDYDFKKIKSQLLRHEGLNLKPYKDTKGLITIGVGRCLQIKGISHDEAMILLKNDIDEAAESVGRILPWSENLSEDQFLVLVNMCFQMGVSGLLGFRKFLSFLQKKKFDKAGEEMLNSKWAKEDSPARAYELFSILTSKPSEVPNE